MSTKSTLKKVAIYTLGAFSGIALSLSVQSFAAEKDKKDNEALPVQTIRTMAEVYGQNQSQLLPRQTRCRAL